MNIKELQSALRLLEQVYSAGGAREQAKSVAVLIDALDDSGEQSVEAYVEAAKCRLSKTASGPATKSREQSDLEVVEQHLAQLFAAGTDRQAFDRALANLKSDSHVRIAECLDIANGYKNRPSGGTFRYKFDSKSKALDFIFDTYLGRAQDVSKTGIIDRLTKWASS